MMCFLHPKGYHTQFAVGGRGVMHFNYNDDNGGDGHDDDDESLMMMMMMMTMMMMMMIIFFLSFFLFKIIKVEAPLEW